MASYRGPLETVDVDPDREIFDDARAVIQRHGESAFGARAQFPNKIALEIIGVAIRLQPDQIIIQHAEQKV